jgi:hypothetical protein
MRSSIWKEVLDLVWPVLRQEVLKKMTGNETLLALLFFLACILLINLILRHWLGNRDYEPGSFQSEFIKLLSGIIAFVVPVVLLYWQAEKRYPILTALFEQVIELTGLDAKVRVWVTIIILGVGLTAFERVGIYLVFSIFQRAVSFVPGREIWVEIVVLIEVIFYSVSTFMLPANIILIAEQAGEWNRPHPLLDQRMNYPRPDGVPVVIWNDITEGLARARQNGAVCDPYLHVAFKEYETRYYRCGTNMTGMRECVSSVGCLGAFQFAPETFATYAERYGVADRVDIWNPSDSAEVACYAMQPEGMNISLEMSEEEFVYSASHVPQVSGENYVWNADPKGMRRVYARALELHAKYDVEASLTEETMQGNNSLPTISNSLFEFGGRVDGLLWPAPAGSYVTFQYGVEMSNGWIHNGIDIVLSGFPPYKVVALADGKVRYWNGGDCNAGVIDLQTADGETFQYVHMELDPSKIFIPVTGAWVEVSQGQELGWILDRRTTCSDGPHLHIMRIGGGPLYEAEFTK